MILRPHAAGRPSGRLRAICRRTAIAAVLLLGGCREGQEVAAPNTPTAPAPTVAATPVAAGPARLRIEGETRLVLPRNQNSFEIPIAPADARSRLSVALGLTPVDEPDKGVVQLVVGLRSDGEPDRLLYNLDAEATGWHDVAVEVDASGLTNPRLVLQRKLQSGTMVRALRTAISLPALTSVDAPLPRSVLLLSLDTLRADRVGAYGDKAARTPVLDALARDGTLFTDAYSPSLWTLPSHASLFYGAHLPDTPEGLRAQGNAAAALDIPGLPVSEILRQRGYATAGFTGGGFLGPPFDFARGFDAYYAFPHAAAKGTCPPERFDGPEVFRRAGAWLRANGHRPFFLFVHTYDVHDRCPFVPTGGGEFGAWPALDDTRQAALQAHYRDLIAQTDQRVGELLEALAASGAGERTLVVVTSDHGEALSEHDQRGHSCRLRPYDEVSRVPLILRAPGRVPAGERIETPVSLIDVAPSILSLLDVPVPPWMAGHPLPGLGLQSPDPAPPVAVLCDRQLALRVGDDKLLAEYGVPERDELYDLAGDPAELHNRAATDSATLETLRALAASTWQPSQFPKEAKEAPIDEKTLDPAARERLRALGYLE